jgi:hypothetical protein
MNTVFECAVTGMSADGGESGPLGNVPLGWTEITIARQVVNPKWVAIQQLKEVMVANVLNQIQRAEDRSAQIIAINLQVDAQFAALEASTPKILKLEEKVYLADLAEDEALVEAFDTVREALGLPLVRDSLPDPAETNDANAEAPKTPAPASPANSKPPTA